MFTQKLFYPKNYLSYVLGISIYAQNMNWVEWSFTKSSTQFYLQCCSNFLLRILFTHIFQNRTILNEAILLLCLVLHLEPYIMGKQSVASCKVYDYKPVLGYYRGFCFSVRNKVKKGILLGYEHFSISLNSPLHDITLQPCKISQLPGFSRYSLQSMEK